MGADVGVGRGEHALDLLIDGRDDAAQLAPCRAHVVELFLEERVALLQLAELLERQRVDRTEQAQLALELADARRGRHAVGQLRRRSGLGGVGLDVEVVAQHLDGRLQPQPGLGLVELAPAGPLSNLVELALGRAAPPTSIVETRRHRGDRRRSAPGDGLEPVAVRGDRSPPLARRTRPAARGPATNARPACAGARPSSRSAASAARRRSASARRPVSSSRRSWRPAARSSRSRRRPTSRAARRVDRGADLAACPGRRLLGGGAGLEVGQRARRARRCAPARRPPARRARRCAAAAARPRRGSHAARPASGPAPRWRR